MLLCSHNAHGGGAAGARLRVCGKGAEHGQEDSCLQAEYVLDVVQIRQGMRHLVQQVSAPPVTPPRRKIGFVVDRGGKSPNA